MDRSLIPFPSLPPQAEELQNVDPRPAIPSRVHSSPSLPNLWLPSLNGSLPPHLAPRIQARYRPHLRPLDLASSPTSTPTKLRGPYTTSVEGEPSGSPSRAPSLLTPPLTPSSSFNSHSHDTPSTPPEANSPLRWTHRADYPFSDALIADADYSPTSLKGHPSLPQAGYLTPSSGRTHSISSDGEAGYSPASVGRSEAADMVSALGMGMIDLDLTPRDERNLALSAQELSMDVLATVSTPSRFLMIKNVPPSTSSSTLRSAFSSMGDIKGIFVRFQLTHGAVLLAFFDVRHASRAKCQISGQTLAGLEDVRLEAGFVTQKQLEILTGRSAFVTEMDGAMYVTVEDRNLEAASIHSLLASFGELLSFEATGVDPHDQTYHVEFYDIRDAASAFKALNNRTMFGARFRLSVEDSGQPQPSGDPLAAGGSYQTAVFNPTGATHSSQQDTDRSLQGRVRPRSVSASESMGAPDAARRAWKAQDSPLEHGRRPSNDLFFDAVGKVPVPPETPSRPRSISIGADDMARASKPQRPSYENDITAPAYQHAYTQGYPTPSVPMYSSSAYAYSQPMYPLETPMYGHMEADAAMSSHWSLPASSAPSMEYYLPPSPRSGRYQSQQASPVTVRKAVHDHTRHQQQYGYFDQAVADEMFVCAYTPDTDAPHLPSVPYTTTTLEFEGDARPPPAGQDKNQLNISAIEEGKDMRTTVMIKNIPNKMSDRDLMAFINKVCPRRIDFMYLRMDFQNGCNVGYAFVNFITVGDLLHFAKTQLGVKWNMYSSEKVLQMCYATYQGKEALVEKFKNSCIMDERESWRPKIFYSDGPNQGLPEPFPPPTHLRRKERSSHNRGALFVPSAHHMQGNGPRRDGGSMLYHHRAHPPRMSMR